MLGFAGRKADWRMKKAGKHLGLIIVLVMSVFFCSACAHVRVRFGGAYDPDNMKLKNVDPNGENTVWLQECGEYVPYVVGDKNYDGKVLLIRREPLADKIPYRDENAYGSGAGYYPGGDADLFLNGEFYDRMAQEVRDAIKECEIVVTSEDTVTRGDNRRRTEKISRKVFLLSVTELGNTIDGGFMCAKEGRKIDLVDFDDYLVTEPEWLRSAYLWDDVHAWSVSSEAYGEEAVGALLCVRPAFTMSRDTALVKADETVISYTMESGTGYMLAP